MRKNEKAKIRIKKKKYGFGRKDKLDIRKFPKGYETLSTDSATKEEIQARDEARKRLISKGIIYEVKLLDWIERVNVLKD